VRHSGSIALLVAILLGAVAGIAYAPSTGFPFVQYDDDIRLLSNPAVRQGLSAGGLSWAFTSIWDASWSPLTWLSHMLDFTLYANDAGGHHTTNVLLHAVNVALLFLMLRAATGDEVRAAFVALLLALHPIHIETVAWVSERKGLLSSTFALLALWGRCVGRHDAVFLGKRRNAVKPPSGFAMRVWRSRPQISVGRRRYYRHQRLLGRPWCVRRAPGTRRPRPRVQQ
jgi:hypothetical protein